MAESESTNPSQIPPATLSFLIQTLGSQALVALGVIANPLTGESRIEPAQARHFIDMLAVLESKTEGNRTAEESEFLRTWLSQLRMAFLQAQQPKP